MKTNVTPAKHAGAAFITFNPYSDEGRKLATEAAKSLTGSYQAVARTTYRDFDTNISVKDEFTRGDYEYFRPRETVPKYKKDIISFCMEAYRRVGLVRNIIDLMGDFCVQGIRIVHPNKQKQKLLRGWAKKVKFKHVSERFANMLFRAGNVVVRRATARLPVAEEEQMIAQGAKLEADTVTPDSLSINRRTIPIQYTFLNPLSLEIIGGELAQFTGKQIIGIKIAGKLRQQITSPKPEEEALLSLVPQFIINAVKQGKQIIPLEQDKLVVAHYKKDDWQSWADPMTYAILDDLILLEKMKLADLAALDGAISQVRLWKLGDLDKGILPTDDAIDKLAEILMSNPGGGAFDLIWGPDLTVEEYKTNVHQFLGDAKYGPVLKAIFAGLGVPPTLTGTEGSSGTTNNFISLQTMIQRLEYVRDKIREFWEQELELFRQSMNWQEGGRIIFDRMILNDEAAEKALLIQLWDRNLVSDEGLLEKFKEIPDLEVLRSRRENRERKRKSRQPKVGPYFATEESREYMKIALQRGYIDPRDLDIEITHEPTPFDAQLKAVEKAKQMQGGGVSKTKGKSGQGRPKTSKDSGSRKSKTFKARTSAEQAEVFADFMTKNIWAKEAQRDISEILNPVLLRFYSKNSLRELSEEEASKAEKVKFAVLANLEPFSEVKQEKVYELIQNKVSIPKHFNYLFEELLKRAYSVHDRPPSLEERRVIQTSVFSLLK